jgi:universal stress protein A
MKIKAARRSRNVVIELKRQEPALSPADLSQVSLKRILVPIDFSAASRKAAQYAVAFAKQFNAEVMLLHVVETLPLPSESFLFEMGTLDAKSREEAAKQLSLWRNELLSEVRSKAVVRDHTSAPHEIVTAAAETNADLIVMGTQGRTGLAHLLIGSTAERVVRYAHCPVLVVREQESDFVQVRTANRTRRGKEARSGTKGAASQESDRRH